jgi:hypothetical protein
MPLISQRAVWTANVRVFGMGKCQDMSKKWGELLIVFPLIIVGFYHIGQIEHKGSHRVFDIEYIMLKISN